MGFTETRRANSGETTMDSQHHRRFVLIVAVLLLFVSLPQQSNGAVGANSYVRAPLHNLVDVVKYSGCTVDGLLDGVHGKEAGPNATADQAALFDAYVDLVSRSNCVYINRAVETWSRQPDFAVIAANMAKIRLRLNRPVVFGAFIAESVSLSKKYVFPEQSRYFDATKMCRPDLPATKNDCYASFKQPEYQEYVAYVIRRSIDLGIQVFLIGGSSLTDHRGTVETSGLLRIIREMRAYAAQKGITILFIAQNPSSFGGPAYAAKFDLIQGGVYINANGGLPETGTVTNKGAVSVHAPPRIWLITHPGDGARLYDPHKLVIEYDWFGNGLDDTSEIACLSVKSQTYLNSVRALSAANCPLGRIVGSAVPATRAIYAYFKSIGAGFWLPGRQPIAFPPWFYTPLNRELYRGDRRFAVNFDDENILRIPGEVRH